MKSVCQHFSNILITIVNSLRICERASGGRRKLCKVKFLIEKEKMITNTSFVNYLSGKLMPFERDSKDNHCRGYTRSHQGHVAEETL